MLQVDIPRWTDLGLYDAATSLRLSVEEYAALEEFVEATGSKVIITIIHAQAGAV